MTGPALFVCLKEMAVLEEFQARSKRMTGQIILGDEPETSKLLSSVVLTFCVFFANIPMTRMRSEIVLWDDKSSDLQLNTHSWPMPGDLGLWG